MVWGRHRGGLPRGGGPGCSLSRRWGRPPAGGTRPRRPSGNVGLSELPGQRAWGSQGWTWHRCARESPLSAEGLGAPRMDQWPGSSSWTCPLLDPHSAEQVQPGGRGAERRAASLSSGLGAMGPSAAPSSVPPGKQYRWLLGDSGPAQCPQPGLRKAASSGTAGPRGHPSLRSQVAGPAVI